MSKYDEYHQATLTVHPMPPPVANAVDSAEPGVDNVQNFVVIERRTLIRECLTRCFNAALGTNIVSFPDVRRWIEVKDQTPASVIVLSIGGKWKSPELVEREIDLLKRTAPDVPIILLSDAEETSQVVEALERGARGYIPTSASLSIAIEAMRLVRAGGVYAPAGSLIAASSQKYANENSGHKRMFTERQSDVLEALCQGKANKIIAYELKLRESTVKIHVRHIMKKLKAKNRTEVAYKAQGLMNREGV